MTRRFGTWAAAGVGVVSLGVGLSGCADSAALGLVRQACHHVELSLTLYRSAQTEPDAQRAEQERYEAGRQLRIASPLAAIAAGEAPQWQAFMATLAENSRLPESDLVHALQAQCGAVSAGGSTDTIAPATTLPRSPG
jgi:hypothetical protein